MTEEDLMLTSILNCRRVDLTAEPKILTNQQKIQLEQMLNRRAQGEPLQYILGYSDFNGIHLSVDPRVLIPRPETEILVEQAVTQAQTIQKRDTLRVLDLGTGSGNIAIAVAKSSVNCFVTAIDINEGALAVAYENARANQVDQKIAFIRQDMTEYLLDASKKGYTFDVVISNPPYIPTLTLAKLPMDVQQEPKYALDGGEDGLKYYRPIIEYSHQVLSCDGFLLCEIGDGQHTHIDKMFKQYPQYSCVSYYNDYVGTKRIVTARVEIARERSV